MYIDSAWDDPENSLESKSKQNNFWRKSPYTVEEVENYLNKFHDVVSTFVMKNKKFPKDDIGFIRLGYIFDEDKGKYAFEFLFDPYSSDEEFMKLYKNGEVGESDVEIFNSIFINVQTLLQSCNKFVKFYMVWIKKNIVEYDSE